MCFLMLLSAALLHSAQSLPAGRGRGLDPGGGVRRQRRDAQNMLPYEDRMMSLPVQESEWRGRGLEQALQRLVERDQRREQEEEQQRDAYLSAVLRLLSDADRAGLMNPEVELVEEDQELDQGPLPQDYDETGRRLSMSRPRAPWWTLVEPQLAQALLQRLDPQVSEALMNRVQASAGARESDQDTLRRLVARILLSLGPSDAVMSSGHRMRRELPDPAPSALHSGHRRSRRSLDDDAPPSDDPPLLRVKRLDEDEPEPRPQQQPGLQRIKRVDVEEDHGSRRRKRRAAAYDPQILLSQVLELIRD